MMKKTYNIFFVLIFSICVQNAYSAQLNLSASQNKNQLNKISKIIKCGDTVRLEEGEYFGRLRLNNLKCGRPTIISSSLSQSNGFASVGSIVISNSSNVIISNLTFQNGDASLRLVSSDTVILEKNKFHGVASVIPLKIRNSKNIIILGNEFQANATEQINIGKSKNIVFSNNKIFLGRHAALQFYPYGSVKNVLVSKNIFSAREGRAVEFFMTDNLVFYKNIVEYSGKSQYARDASSKFMTNNGFFISNIFRHNYGIPVAIFPYKKNSYIKNIYLVGNYFMHNEFADIFIGGKVQKLENIYIVNNVFDSALHKFARIKFKVEDEKNIFSRLYIADNFFKKRSRLEKLFKINKKRTDLSEYESLYLDMFGQGNKVCQEIRLNLKLDKLPELVNRSLGWLSDVHREGKEEFSTENMRILKSIKAEIVRETFHVSRTCMSIPANQEITEQNERGIDLLDSSLSWRIKLNEKRLSPIKHKFSNIGADRELKIFSNGKMSINLLGMSPMQRVTFWMDKKCANISHADVLYYSNSLNNLEYTRNLSINQEIIKQNGQDGYLCTIDAKNEMDIKEVVVVLRQQCCFPLIIRSILLY